MKKIFFLLTITLLFSCSKNDDNTPTNPIDQLPPATQTGKKTFGCLLDGKAFTPGAGQNTLDCVYQFVDGGYYFSLQANREINQKLVALGCSTQRLQIVEGNTYHLKEKGDGNASGIYFFEENPTITYTSTIHSGELKITKLTNQIVSGTFWYDIQDVNGVLHQIREGRFDVYYSN